MAGAIFQRGVSNFVKGTAASAKWAVTGGAARSAAVGGAIGFAMPTGLEDTNNSLETRFKNAFVGAAAGFAGKGALKAAPKIGRDVWQNKDLLGQMSIKGSFGLGKMAFSAGKVIVDNPMKSIAIAGAATAAMSYSNVPSSPTLRGANVDRNYQTQTQAAAQMMMGNNFGSAPQMMGRYQRAFIGSTNGLTQGLHRGRHG